MGSLEKYAQKNTKKNEIDVVIKKRIFTQQDHNKDGFDLSSKTESVKIKSLASTEKHKKKARDDSALYKRSLIQQHDEDGFDLSSSIERSRKKNEFDLPIGERACDQQEYVENGFDLSSKTENNHLKSLASTPYEKKTRNHTSFDQRKYTDDGF